MKSSAGQDTSSITSVEFADEEVEDEVEDEDTVREVEGEEIVEETVLEVEEVEEVPDFGRARYAPAAATIITIMIIIA